jgi:NAD(P)-dependent dehydrogenase (short-subunit alcohol dehydrogenase family)
MIKELVLDKKIVLVTGAAKRIGHSLALACGSAGADIIIHYGHSKKKAVETREEIISLGRRAWSKALDLRQPDEVSDLILEPGKIGSIYALINSAAIFESILIQDTALTD